ALPPKNAFNYIFYSSTIETLIIPLTSECNLTGTLVVPSVRIGSGSSIFLRSISILCCFFNVLSKCFFLILFIKFPDYFYFFFIFFFFLFNLFFIFLSIVLNNFYYFHILLIVFIFYIIIILLSLLLNYFFINNCYYIIVTIFLLHLFYLVL